MATESAPATPRRSVRIEAARAAVVGCVATAMGGTLLSARVGLGWWYPLTVVVIFAGVMAVVLATVERHHPFDRFGPANHITTIRAALTALVAALLSVAPPRPGAALGAALFGLLVVVMDGVDGHFARRSRMASSFGARFDMEVDALLILALAALVWRHGKAGAWVLASGLLRYGFAAAGLMWHWLKRPLDPSRRRQAVCVVQIAGLLLALAPFIRVPLSTQIAATALAVLGWSFAVDVLWLWRRRVAHAVSTS